MSIAPVCCSVRVRATPARAFEAFTREIGRWWTRGRTVAERPHADIVIEPRAGGRWFERADDGTETAWGCVLAWEPPMRLLLGWQLGADFKFDPAMLTEVELRFLAQPDGSTEVTLEHRDLQRFGAHAERVREQISTGWPRFMGSFAEYFNRHAADQHATEQAQ